MWGDVYIHVATCGSTLGVLHSHGSALEVSQHLLRGEAKATGGAKVGVVHVY